MTGPNESPAPVAAGREAIFDGAGKHTDTSGTPPDVNPVSLGSRDGVMSLFTSAIHPIPCGTTTADALWDLFRSDQYAEAIGQIRALTQEVSELPEGSSEWKEKKDAKDKLKRGLAAVSMSCRITSGGRGKAGEEGRVELSGFLQIDLDGKDHPGLSVSELKKILKHDPHIQHVAVSPSGDGVKALCRIGRVETREGVDADRSLPTFKDAYASAENHYATLGLTLDPSCRDVARLCYVTHDADAWSRPERAIELPISKGVDALRGKVHPGGSASLTNGFDARPSKGTATGYGLNDLEAMVYAIGPQVTPDGEPGNYASYSEWLMLGNAAYDGFGAAAIPILEKWRPCKPGELEEKFQPKNRLKKVKFNYLLKAARKCGWVKPHAGRAEIEIPSEVFPVPGGEISISMAAECIFSIIAPTHSLFIRNTTVTELVVNDGQKEMSSVGADRVCSLLEGFGKQVSRLRVTDKEGEKHYEWISTTFTRSAAATLIVTNEARRLLPPLRQIVGCPIITPGGVLSDGYHAHAGGTIIQSAGEVPELPVELAVVLFGKLLDGFQFGSPLQPAEAEHLLEGAAELVWFSSRLGEFTGPIQSIDSDSGNSREPEIESYLKGVKRMRRWLLDGKKVSLAALQLPNFQAYDSPKARRFAECMIEEIRTGKLSLLRLPKEDRQMPLPLAAIRVKGESNWLGIYCLHGSPSLLDSERFPEALYRRVISESDLKSALSSAENVAISQFEAATGQLHRFVLDPGRSAVDSLKPVIEEFFKTPLAAMTIQDRYCVGSDGNLDATLEFLGIAANLARQSGLSCPGQLIIQAGPLSPRANGSERNQWQTRLKTLESKLKKDHFWKSANIQAQFRSGGYGGIRDFHDRIIEGRVSQGGKVILEMTGGIDIIMDTRERTRLFLCRLD